MSIFEAGMMVCFGASWPMSLWKLWSTRQTGGMSLRFLLLVATGYLCGIIHKLGNHPDWVTWLYVINLAMVATAIFLVIHYRRKKDWKKT